MALDVLGLGLATSYTDEIVEGGGAIKGKNCTVDDISKSGKKNTVRFKWTLDDGTVLTGNMEVLDGEDGAPGTPGANGKDGKDGADGDPGPAGKGIASIEQVTGESKILITYDDGTESDPIDIPTVAGKDGKDGTDGQDGQDGVGVPAGGTTGQVLKKKSGTDYDTEWENESGGDAGIPSGGTTGQVLSKRSNVDYDAIWTTPSGGGSSDIIYSTTEQRIGTWIDGKNVYRIVLSGDTLPANATTLISGVSNLISCGGEQLYTDGSTQIRFTFPYNVPNDTVLKPELYESDNTIKLNSSGSSLSNISKYNWWFEYTHATPNGSTVTPTDDVQILLECAEVDAPYTTISEVLADSVIFNTILSNGNAMAYFARSTTWAATVCASSTVMTAIGASNIASDALLASENWTLAILDSAYYSSILNVEVPVMTSSTTPSGTASARSEYSSSSAGWKAFDGDDTTYWATGGQVSLPQWVEYEFDFPMKIHACGLLVNEGDGKQYTRDCEIKASNNSDWDTLLSFTVPSDEFTYVKRFISNSTAYTTYRLNVTSTYNMPPEAHTLQFYGRRDVVSQS